MYNIFNVLIIAFLMMNCIEFVMKKYIILKSYFHFSPLFSSLFHFIFFWGGDDVVNKFPECIPPKKPLRTPVLYHSHYQHRQPCGRPGPVHQGEDWLGARGSGSGNNI